MKKILLIPTTLAITIAPFITLTSCNKDEEEIEVEPTDPLCFTDIRSFGTHAQISYTIDGSPLDIKIRYKLDEGQWQNWPKGEKITLLKNQKLYVWNAKNTLSKLSSCFKFVITGGVVKASGNVNSMVNNSKLTNGCFNFLFSDCETLVEPPELPAMELAPHCYQNMFNGCINLTKAPQLPAEYLADSCYLSMFNNCKEIKEAPELNSMHLAPHCYEQMFEICGLTNAPNLPATTLADSCYAFMFCHCPITKTPSDLSATNLAEGCYRYMFSNCRNLEETMDSLPATVLKEKCYDHMFAYCDELITAPELKGEFSVIESEAQCYEKMFKDCPKLTIKESTTNADNLICRFGDFDPSFFASEMFGGSTARESGFIEENGTPTQNHAYYWVGE